MSLNPHLHDWIVLTLVLASVTIPLGAQAGAGAKPAAQPAMSASPSTGGQSTFDIPAHPLSGKEQREAQIAADTAKLYQLAQELKVELDKSTKDTLSLTVIKKAAEIEKLAHSLSERMKSN